jgi:hypothetical protein
MIRLSVLGAAAGRGEWVEHAAITSNPGTNNANLTRTREVVVRRSIGFRVLSRLHGE